jgi:hypothetical protein
VPITPEDFHRMALSFPEAFEGAHMGHPDFRVRGGKIFATLSPDHTLGMVKLTPQQQEAYVAAEPAIFVPVNGGWGRGGATHVRLAAATKAKLRGAMAEAWHNAAQAPPAPARRAQRGPAR